MQKDNNESQDNGAQAQKGQKGIVKFFNASKGFGFIKQESGQDLFFHVSEMNGVEPKDGDNVEFEIGQGRKGPCAIKVKVVN